MIGMKKYVRISLFAHFKRLRDRPTDQPTDQLTNRPTDMTSYRYARKHLKSNLDRTKVDPDFLYIVASMDGKYELFFRPFCLIPYAAHSFPELCIVCTVSEHKKE